MPSTPDAHSQPGLPLNRLARKGNLSRRLRDELAHAAFNARRCCAGPAARHARQPLLSVKHGNFCIEPRREHAAAGSIECPRHGGARGAGGPSAHRLVDKDLERGVRRRGECRDGGAKQRGVT